MRLLRTRTRTALFLSLTHTSRAGSWLRCCDRAATSRRLGHTAKQFECERRTVRTCGARAILFENWNWYKTQTQNALSWKEKRKKIKEEKPKWWKFTVGKIQVQCEWAKLLQAARAQQQIEFNKKIKWSELPLKRENVNKKKINKKKKLKKMCDNWEQARNAWKLWEVESLNEIFVSHNQAKLARCSCG